MQESPMQEMQAPLTGHPVISATGLFTPADSISNEELVASFNAFVDRHNAANPDVEPLAYSSVEFIEKASGIKSRHVMSKAPILDPAIMCPRLPERGNDELSVMAEIGVAAARQALERAGRKPEDVDAVLCAASNMQRAYPAMAIEIQQALGIDGFGFDMNVACSSATFGIQTAADYIRAGNARSVLVVSPEITSGHLNWRDRDSHFIFGDVATAVLVEDAAIAPAEHWAILGTKLKTVFSNNIRNNFGFLNRAAAALGNPRHEAEDGVLQQHPQQFRLPQPRRARDGGYRRQAVRAGRPQGVPGSGADGGADDP